MHDSGVDPIRSRLLALLDARRAERHAEIERLLSKDGAGGRDAPGGGAAVLDASLERRRAEIETGRRRLEELRALVLGREPSLPADRRAEAAASSFAPPVVRLDIDALRRRNDDRRREAEALAEAEARAQEEESRLERTRRAELERRLESLNETPEPAAGPPYAPELVELERLIEPSAKASSEAAPEAPQAAVAPPAALAEAVTAEPPVAEAVLPMTEVEPSLPAAALPPIEEPVPPKTEAPVLETPAPEPPAPEVSGSSSFSMRSLYKSRTPPPPSEPEAPAEAAAPALEFPAVDVGPAAELDLQAAELERALVRLREIQSKLGRPQL